MMKQIMMICLMIVISTSSSPLGDSRSVDERMKITNGEEKSPIKKAYTYVSEYKRLPVFNFGIGKRWTGTNGIKGAQPYSFGFGKRSTSTNGLYPLRMGMNYLPYEAYENYLNEDMSEDANRSQQQDNKRSGRMRLYDFGVGKRMIPHFAAGSVNENPEDYQAVRKLINEDPNHSFIYGSSNRFLDNEEDIQEDE